MPAWSPILLSALLAGQGTEQPHPRPPGPPAPHLKIRKPFQSPQELIRVMVAQDQAQRKQPGALVEVIGYDDEAVLKLLLLKMSQKASLEFRNTDKLQAQELRAFMQQDPSHPSPALILPVMPGGPVARTDDKWLK
jgi:hypothetical protein